MKTPLEDKMMAHFGRILMSTVRDHQVENWTRHITDEILSGNPDFVDLGSEALGRFMWLLPQIIDSTLYQLLTMLQDGEVNGIVVSVRAQDEMTTNINTSDTPLTEALGWWILAFSKQRYMLDKTEPKPKAAILNFAKPSLSADDVEGEMLAMSMQTMQERCFSHQDIVAKQRHCFEQVRQGVRGNTMDEHTAIAKESLITGNVPQEEARQLASQSRSAIELLGFAEPVRIPWATDKHIEHPALVYFAKNLIEEVRDFTIHDWDMILSGTMRSILAGDVPIRFQNLTLQAHDFVHDLVPQVVDKTLHYMMMLFQQSCVNGIRIMVTLEDGSTFPSLDSVSDGLAGDLVDWVPAFSKQRVTPSPYQEGMS